MYRCEKICWYFDIAFSRPGSDRLSRVLRRSTMGAGAFHGRVRNGNGCSHPAITTRSAKGNVEPTSGRFSEKLVEDNLFFTRLAHQPDKGFAFAGTEQTPCVRLIGQTRCVCPEMSMVNENDQANRAISTGKLHALLHFHTRPINVVVFHGSDREHSFSGGFPA